MGSNKDLNCVTDISLNYKHILAVDKNNEVYAWGYNQSGRCGVDSDETWVNQERVQLGHTLRVLYI